MRSVRRRLAWLPLWALVLLAGGCEGMASKSISIVSYLLIPSNFNSKNNIDFFWEGGQVKKTAVIVNPDNIMFGEGKEKFSDSKFIKKLGEDEKNSTVFSTSGGSQLSSRRNYKNTLHLIITNEEGDSEKFTYTFERKYLEAMQDYEAIDVLFKSEKYGELYCLVCYYFTMSI